MKNLEKYDDWENWSDLTELDKMTREMMIISGFELGARHIIDRNVMKIANMKYSEDNIANEMLENEDTVQEINRYAFLNRPSLIPRKKWSH